MELFKVHEVWRNFTLKLVLVSYLILKHVNILCSNILHI